MSRSEIPQIQKYLGWLQRYLFNVEMGPINPVIPVVNIADEPFEWLPIRIQANTVVGNLQYFPLNDPTLPQETERRFVFAWANITGALPATDVVLLSLLRLGIQNPLFRWTGVATGNVPVIRGYQQTGVAGASFGGIQPVVCGPGDQLRIDHSSVAGGVATEFRALVIRLPKSYPFPGIF